MIKSLLFIFLFSSFIVYSQFNEKTVIEDFNKDGVKDTLHSSYDGGSGFGGTNLRIVNGRTNESFKLDNYGAYSQIQSTVIIPEILNLEKNRPFYQVLEKRLFPKIRKKAEASLLWIINGIYHHKRIKENTFFDLVINPKSKWIKGDIEIPKPYAISVEKDTLKKMFTGEFAREFKKEEKGILTYYSGVHYARRKEKKVRKIEANRNYTIYDTAHGVLVKNADKYKWLFISDVNLTGAPDKLRWPSITKVKLYGKHVVIHQSVPPDTYHNIYVVNIETGITARLKYRFYDKPGFNKNEMTTFLIQKDKIHLSIENDEYENELKVIKLNRIFKELKKMSKLVTYD